MAFFQNAITLAPSYLSSFLQPDLGQTQFQPNSAFNDFLGKAAKDGEAFILPTRFIVLFENPWLENKFNFVATGMSNRLTMRCYTANVPQRFFATHERIISGPKRMIPYTTQYDELSLQFYCGQDLAELNFFQDWMDGIINPVSREASYYDDYAKHSKITILFVHNSLKTMEGIIKAFRNGNLSGIRFLEAYPRTMSINGGPLEWASKSSPLFVNITFGTREFVNIRTYDAELDRQLKELEKLNMTQQGVDNLLKQSGEKNAAVDGEVINKSRKMSAAKEGLLAARREHEEYMKKPVIATTTDQFGNTLEFVDTRELGANVAKNGAVYPPSGQPISLIR